jgi:hypothetical protein
MINKNNKIVSPDGNGLVYSTNYNTGFVTYSLVDKNYVDNIMSTVPVLGVTAGSGLTAGGTGSFITLGVNVSNGLVVIDDYVQLSQTVSGNGLTYSAGVIDVNVNSDSIEIGNDSLRLKNTITGDRTFGDSVTINGNLRVSGTASYVYTDDLYVKDNIVVLNATWSGAPLLDSGLMINRGSSQSARLIWNESVDYWQLGMSGSESTIITERGTGLSKTGNMLEVNYSEVPKKYAEYGLSLTANVAQAINHNIGTASVLAQAWDISTGENLNLVFKNRQSNSLDILSTVSVVVDVIIIG